MSTLHLGHWRDGGNALTNFFAADTYIYARAIDEYGDPSLYIGPPTPNGLRTDKALRFRGPRKDRSDFWAVFDRVKAAAKANQGAPS